MVAKVGDVFNYPGTRSELSYGNDRHIHIVVKIDEGRLNAYLVPLSSDPVYWDRTCEISRTDGCPFVTKRCFASYANAKKAHLGGMQDAARFGGPASEDLLARVIAGVRTSRHSPQWFKDAVCPVPKREAKIHRSA
jgi:hypothetical protein